MSAPSNGSSGASVLVLILLIAIVVNPMPARSSSHASDDKVFVEVEPDRVEPGFKVGLRASCGERVSSATVRSPAFGEVTVHADHGKQLTGSVTIPHSTQPGRYRVELYCPDGAKAHTELEVTKDAKDGHRPSRGPDTGGGGTAEGADSDSGGAPVLLAGAGVAALATGAWLLSRWRRRAG